MELGDFILSSGLRNPTTENLSDVPRSSLIETSTPISNFITSQDQRGRVTTGLAPLLNDGSVTSSVVDVQVKDTESPVEKARSPTSPTFHEGGSIELKQHLGKSFVLPLALCQTWQDMEQQIKILYQDDEQAIQEIENGEYEMYTATGATVLPCYWDMLVAPGWEVTVRLQSQTEPPIDPKPGSNPNSNPDYESGSESNLDTSQHSLEKEIESDKPTYIPKVNYTIAYWVKDQWPDDKEKLVLSKSYDYRVQLERSNRIFQELPVLEEEKRIITPQRDKSKLGSRLERGPKLDSSDVVSKTSLRIHSPFLLNALRSIIKYSAKEPSGDAKDELETGVFLHPYEDLFYHTQELSDYKNETSGPRANHTQEYNRECDLHIDTLLQYLVQEPSVQFKSAAASWAKKVPTTTFARFWLLMKPGSDVYLKENGQLNAYVVDSVSDGVNYLYQGEWSISVQDYSIRLWNLRYNGKSIKRMSKVVKVAVFDNEREVTSLVLMPTRFQDGIDGGARKKQLIERGKKVFRFSKGPAFLEYTGVGLKPGLKKYNRARVIVEHESKPWCRDEFISLHTWKMEDEQEGVGERARCPSCGCSECLSMDYGKEEYMSATFSDYDEIDPKEIEELSDHQYMLFASHMFGFVLKDRAYELLDVGGLSNVGFMQNAIDRLVMRPEENKDPIKAIVRKYGDSNQSELCSADHIHGKGEGQIFLLHGPPGTGKTLTAESVAEYTRRPLLSINAADLGDKPTDVERNLLRFLKDANDWDAIVLLDEADVYLERRSTSDLRRNSIVSSKFQPAPRFQDMLLIGPAHDTVFLRAMDYFQGILFLTTNRVGHFDEAVMSRIHISIGYMVLDDEARKKIWANLFLKLEEDQASGGPEIHHGFQAREYIENSTHLKELKWNGREIRNAFQTAVALAVFDAKSATEKRVDGRHSIPMITDRHLRQVVNMSAAFKEYITATHEGYGDSDFAYVLGNRNDRSK